jgi:transposase-like protein
MIDQPDIVNRLRAWSRQAAEQGVAEVTDGLLAAADEIERLRKQRDEARREICHMVFASGGIRPAEYAKAIGWDCFEGETP